MRRLHRRDGHHPPSAGDLRPTDPCRAGGRPAAKGIPVEGQAIAHLVATPPSRASSAGRVRATSTYVLLEDWIPRGRRSTPSRASRSSPCATSAEGPATAGDLALVGVTDGASARGAAEHADRLKRSRSRSASVDAAPPRGTSRCTGGPPAPSYDTYLLGYRSRDDRGRRTPFAHPSRGGRSSPRWGGRLVGVWRSAPSRRLTIT